MKKPILYCFISLLTAFSAIAQDDMEIEPAKEVKKFRFGLTGSPIISWVKPDTKGLENDGVKIGFNYGLLTDFVLSGNGNYAFSTGIKVANLNGGLKYADYTNFGTDSVRIDDHSSTEEDLHLRYVEIPLTLKMRTNEIGYMTYYGQFGLDLGFNIKSNRDYNTTSSSNGSINVSEEDVDYSEKAGLFRTALHVGLGAEYNLTGSTSLMFGVSFSNGFTNIYSGKADNYFELDDSGKVDDTKINYNETTGEWQPDAGIKRKAISNYVSIDLGVFF